MKILIADLRAKIVNTIAQNFTMAEAESIADYLLWAEMSGVQTQGIVKMTGTQPLQDIKPKHAIKIDRDTKLSQLIDAGANPAPLVSQLATDVVISKAKEHGFGIVGVHNTFSSNGAQAFYADRIASADLIGLVMARSPASAVAFDGIDPIFGTNPIGFSFPTDDNPLVFDMATSAMTFYGLIIAKTHGEKIPEGMAVDHDGNLTTDPEAAMNGALLSFDRSYKGSGIGMVVEMMAGPLVKAAYGQLEGEWGSLFVALDPDLLVDTGEFKRNASELVAKIKAARTRPGIDSIRLPGERAQASFAAALNSGYVEVDEVLMRQLGYA